MTQDAASNSSPRIAPSPHLETPVDFTGLVPLGSEAEKRTDVGLAAEPGRIIDQGDETQRIDRADARDRHQAARYGMNLGFSLHGLVEIGARLTQRA
jgi:hypothetical protein